MPTREFKDANRKSSDSLRPATFLAYAPVRIRRTLQFAPEELGVSKSGVCARAAQRWHGMDGVPEERGVGGGGMSSEPPALDKHSAVFGEGRFLTSQLVSQLK